MLRLWLVFLCMVIQGVGGLDFLLVVVGWVVFHGALLFPLASSTLLVSNLGAVVGMTFSLIAGFFRIDVLAVFALLLVSPCGRLFPLKVIFGLLNSGQG